LLRRLRPARQTDRWKRFAVSSIRKPGRRELGPPPPGLRAVSTPLLRPTGAPGSLPPG
jgi:hypothetical protein